MFWKNKSKFFAVSDSTNIHYVLNFKPEELCENDTVIILNYGLVCNFEHFKYQADFFHEKGFKVLMHDYRCHYESTSSDGIESCTFVNMVNDLKKLIDYLNLKKYVMLGHSMGVNVTLEFSRKYPDDLKGMVLISGTVFPPQDIMFDSNIIDIAEPALHQIRNTLGMLYDKLWKNSHKSLLAKLVVWQGGFNMRKTKIDFVEHYMKKIGELAPDLFYFLLTQMRFHNIINDLDKIETPTLIIGGDLDKIIPNYLQRVLNKYLKNSVLYIVKDGSHVPQVDFPETINHRIESFIAKLN